jgi:hypothetical protein
MSILTSVKQLLGIEDSVTVFDKDIIIHINTVFMMLNQLGVGPEIGFSIDDNTTVWIDYITKEQNQEAVKSYMYLNLKLLFDPPASGSVLLSVDRQIAMLEWRLNVQADEGGITDEQV